MANKPQPEPPTEIEPTSTEVALIQDAALLEEFAHMAMAIPTQEGNATEDILRQVLQAKTWEELDAPWSTSALDDVLGKPMRLTGAKRMPSSFAEGLGVFLVLTLVDPRTGEKYVKTTGSLAIVAQVVRAYFLGVTAMTVIWRRAERPSTRGYYPQHLEVVDGHTPETGSGS